MIEITAITAAVLVGGILLYAASRPDAFRIERSATTKAPPETICAQVNDFRAWPT